MNNQFREAFGLIHATEQMKQHTQSVLQSEIVRRQRKHRPSPLCYATACCAVLAFALCAIGGYVFYATPVSYISVDVNPSVELGLNRIDWVVSVAAYNDDGVAVLQNLNLENKPYTKAIELLLADETFDRYLTADALLSFTVVSDKEEELLTGIRQCHGYLKANTECHSANEQLVEDAHHNGVSFGKYQAFLMLSQYDKTITIEECKALSMRQIRNLISQSQGGTDVSMGSGQENRHHGEGGGHGGDHRDRDNAAK